MVANERSNKAAGSNNPCFAFFSGAKGGESCRFSFIGSHGAQAWSAWSLALSGLQRLAHFIGIRVSGRALRAAGASHYLGFGWQLAHHLHHFCGRAENKLGAALRDGQTVEMTEGEPLPGATEN